MDESGRGASARVIDGRVTRKAANALKLTFSEGEGEPFATAVQSGGDGRAAKVWIAFGFANGGPGRHRLVQDDRVLFVTSRERQPSLIDDESGTEVAVVDRVAEGRTDSTARSATGQPLVTFASDSVEPETRDVYRIMLTDAGGADLGRLHVIRRNDGWKSVSDILDSAWTTAIWWDRAGQSLPISFLGTRLILRRTPTAAEMDVLLAACVDIAIGLRPYIPEMS